MNGGVLSGRRVALLVHFDSYLPLAGAVAEAVRRAGGRFELFSLDEGGMSLSPEQLAGAAQIWPALEGAAPTSAKIADLGEAGFLDGYDAVLLGCGGETVKAALRAMLAARPWPAARPVAITGFPGVLDLYRTVGMLCRAASDIALLPAPSQMRAYRAEMRLMLRSPRNGVLFGVAGLPGAARPPMRATPVRTAVYVDQPSIPATIGERRALVHLLADWLAANPEARLKVRERARRAETSIHLAEGPEGGRLSDLIPALRAERPELARADLDDTPLRRLFETCDAAIGVCSAGLLEAVAAGLPTVSLLDFSDRPEYGAHFFGGSGLRRRMADLSAAGWPAPDPQWTENYLLGPETPDPATGLSGMDRLVDALAAKLAAPTPPPNPVDGHLWARKVAKFRPGAKLRALMSAFGA